MTVDLPVVTASMESSVMLGVTLLGISQGQTMAEDRTLLARAVLNPAVPRGVEHE